MWEFDDKCKKQGGFQGAFHEYFNRPGWWQGSKREAGLGINCSQTHDIKWSSKWIGIVREVER